MSAIVITTTQSEHIRTCATLQRICYPTLADEEHLTEDHFACHIEKFPAGQLVAIDSRTGDVVGSTSGFLTSVNFEHFKHHTFLEATDGGWLGNHSSNGEYYYGIDMCVHPDHRGRGIARLLHDARKKLCHTLNLTGQVIGGMIPGFASYKHVLTPEDYVRYVVSGVLFDSTLTTQLRNGFELRGMLKNYLNDPPTDGWSTLLEWRNPDHAELRVPVRRTEPVRN